MTNKTEQIRTAELIKEVSNHPHKEELIELMYEQMEDDHYYQLVYNIT